MSDDLQTKLQHFAALKNKYAASNYPVSSPTSLLYLILRKAELNLEISELELNWLQENQLVQTLDILWLQQYQKQETKRLETELSSLKPKYKVPSTFTASIANALYPILWKLEAGENISQSEITYLKDNQLDATVKLIQQIQEFASLKVKYFASQHQASFPDSPLYQILKQLDAKKPLTQNQANWLLEKNLLETLEIVCQQETERNAEFLQLKQKYRLTDYPENNSASPLYEMLKKLESDIDLTPQEIEWLKQKGPVKLAEYQQNKQEFTELKRKFQARQYQDNCPYSQLYGILKKLNTCQQITEAELNFIKNAGLAETAILAEKISHFAHLKQKYQAGAPQETSPDSYLYRILRELDSEHKLSDSDINWLKLRSLHKTAEIGENITKFTKLKTKYKATQYQDPSPECRLYQILRDFDAKSQITASDIDWLEAQQLSDTKQIIAQILLARHFTYLKAKYKIADPNLPFEPFYEIMCKLEKGERLDEVMVTQLMADKLLSRRGEIAKAHYRQEAQFHEKEYQRTKDIYLVPNISSQWRKAEEPEKALAVTGQVNISLIKDKQFKSRILVTRGAAFRDVGNLEEAENCALLAIQSQPNTHQPYTLMGAICYSCGKYEEGDNWFEKASILGADIDDEIERFVKGIKDKNQRSQAAAYLVKKDPIHYAWAKAYLK